MDEKYIFCKNLNIGILDDNAMYVEFHQTKPKFGSSGIEGEEITDICGVTLSREALSFLLETADRVLTMDNNEAGNE